MIVDITNVEIIFGKEFRDISGGPRNESVKSDKHELHHGSCISNRETHTVMENVVESWAQPLDDKVQNHRLDQGVGADPRGDEFTANDGRVYPS